MHEFGTLPDELPDAEFSRDALSELQRIVTKTGRLLTIAAVYLAPDRLSPRGGLGKVPTRHAVGFQILGQPLAEGFVRRRMAEKAGFKQQLIDEVIQPSDAILVENRKGKGAATLFQIGQTKDRHHVRFSR